MKTSVFVVGPMPPPVHGFSVITDRMRRELSKKAEVCVFDRSPPSKDGVRLSLGFFSSIKTVFLFLNKILISRPRCLYLGLSGGFGLFFDVVYVILAKLFFVKTFAHMHNFSYLNRPSFASRVFFFFSRSVNFISLSPGMGEALSRVYGIDRSKVFPLSNVVFVDGPVLDRSDERSGEYVVGFLSNITREKGVFHYFDLMEKISESCSGVSGVIAGPVDASIKDEFFSRLSKFDNVSYVGPVYGESKNDFFSSIDVLAFPTFYENEAEPVTILEALQQGVFVLASKRGCIEEQLSYGGGSSFLISDFVERASEEVVRMALSEGLRLSCSDSARHAFSSLKDVYMRQLDEISDCICDGSGCMPKSLINF